MKKRGLAILLAWMMTVYLLPDYPAAAQQSHLQESPMEVLIADSLSIGSSGSGRVANAPLNGAVTEAGARTWIGNGGFAFTESGGDSYATSIYSLSATAFVPYIPGSSKASVKLEVKPAGAGWSAVGFSGSNAPFPASGQLWALLGETGSYILYADGTANLLAQGTLTNFDAQRYTKLKVEYDAELEEVSLWADGIVLAEGVDLSVLGSFEPDIQYAGFGTDTQTIGGTAFANFLVKEQAANVLPLVIFDSFGADGIARKAGDSLNNSLTEAGNRTWESSYQLSFNGTGNAGFLTVNASGGRFGMVPYEPAGSVSAIEADIRPAGLNGWSAFGFSSEPSALWSYGQVWMSIREDGYYVLFADATRQVLANGTVAGFDAGGYTRLRLELDHVAGTASAWIGGQQVVNEVTVPEHAAFSLNVQYAGVMVDTQTPQVVAFKNFAVYGEALPVPPEYPDNIEQPEESDFPLGVFEDANLYQGSKKNFRNLIADLHGQGFDSIMMANGDVNRDHAMLEATDRYGLGVYLHAAYNLGDYVHYGNADIAEARTVAAGIVDRVADRPSVKGINLSDEPTIDLVQNHDLLSQAFREQDSGLIITTPLIGFDRVGPMFASTTQDVMLIDIYSLAKANRIGNFNMNNYGYPAWNFLSYLREVTKNKPEETPLWIILQAFGTGGERSSRFDIRSPIAEEVRVQNWLAIGEGAKGIFWFLYTSIPGSSLIGMDADPEVREEVVDLVERVKPLRPLLLDAKKDKERFTVQATGGAVPYISTLVSENGEHTYAVAVNMDAEASQQLTIDSTYFTGQLRNLETDQLYPLGSAITFAAGDGQIYEVVPETTNAEPEVILTAPTGGDASPVNGVITLTAAVTDDGTVAEVMYYANGQAIGTGTGPNWSFAWQGATAGSYMLTAIATDNLGAQGESQPVAIMVSGALNELSNPSFEAIAGGSQPAEWMVASGVGLATDEPHTGVMALFAQGALSGTLVSQEVELMPGKEYELSGWIKTDGVKGSGFSLQYRQESPTSNIHETTPIYGTSDWQRKSITFMAPSYATSGKVSVTANVPYGAGKVWIDNISLVPTGREELSDGLELHLSFDEYNNTQTISYDVSGNGRHADLVANDDDLFTPVPTFFSGKVGSNTLFMQGSDHYVEVAPGFGLDAAGSFTIAGWVKPEDSLRAQTIYSDGHGLEIQLAEHQLRGRLKGSGDTEWATIDGGMLSSDTWYHVVATYEPSGGIKLYVNGQLVAEENSYVYNSAADGRHLFGQTPGVAATTYWGLLDDARIYSRALAPREILRLAEVDEHHELRFETNGGNAISAIYVNHGMAVTAPATPVRAGFSFGGWYTDPALTMQHDFGTPLLADLTLFAKWIALPGGYGSGNGTGNGSGAGQEGEGTAAILINGNAVAEGTQEISERAGHKVAKITVSPVQEQALLQAAGQGAEIIITVTENADIVIGQLSGSMIAKLFRQQSAITVEAPVASFTLPAGSLDIAWLGQQLGAADLQEVTVSISVSRTTAEQSALVGQGASAGGFELVAPVVQFNVSASYDGREVSVELMPAYVQYKLDITDLKEGEAPITGVSIGAKGKARHIPTRVATTANGGKQAILSSMSGGMVAVVRHPAVFTDVQGHWSEQEVNGLGSRLVINGNQDGRFMPDSAITRAEFTAIVIRALGLGEPDVVEAQFADVPQQAWYSGAIATAYHYGLINGFAGEGFRPEAEISREQAMTIIARAMAFPGLPVQFVQMAGESGDGDWNLARFADYREVSPWAANRISGLLQASIVEGNSLGNLSPKALLTRAETVAMIGRLLRQTGLIN
ncbi:hypothetical protein PAT3040_01019 [Paenibacillus agaridevorans]|uniref:SLH domain-containing protein n=1 Tax=Paenibacillus agaridevorans TaxID=171404 RepID=A0A2R5EIR6_9BACL|nr:S-layer homology domain-containing protein [Paenibacillus agaridevorans]GBG06492.1 hypothetical protein PAT3040_01019 [Paenibacillus agaridevorans]